MGFRFFDMDYTGGGNGTREDAGHLLARKPSQTKYIMFEFSPAVDIPLQFFRLISLLETKCVEIIAAGP
ncbi:MAG: hypothetical protein JEZ03_10880 [Bacteroidales bacterium]|nr:hypothetical protein [Bacteroidales bacterium]